MANLGGTNLDSNVPVANGFILLPKGTYKAVIVKDELKPTQTGGQQLILYVQVIEGPYAGTTIIDRLNIVNASKQAQAIAQGTLKKICIVLNQQYPILDTVVLYGRPLEILVGHEEFQSNKTGETLKSNKIRSYNKINSTSASAVKQDDIKW